MIQLRCQERVYNQLERPTILYDSDLYVIIKWGEPEFINDYWKIAHNAYVEAGFHLHANSLCVLELPLNQDIIDRLFNNTGYLKIYLDTELNQFLKRVVAK